MEPENQAALLPFLRRMRRELPDKDIWLYTGYTFEAVSESELLPLVDVLVDGPFVEGERDISLSFRGSRNQRILTSVSYTHLDIMCGLKLEILVREQSPDIALGVDKGGAGDQGIMFGYATNETPEMLPIPYVLATEFLKLLKNYPSRMFRADAKAQVSFDYDSGRITTFLCSVQHSPDVEVGDFRHIIEGLMVATATRYGLNGDFVKLVNPTGRFVTGGSFADCGVTGRKLACDTYGGIGRIGGGALSGKDPSKVDRSAAYMARKIARDIAVSYTHLTTMLLSTLSTGKM